MLVWYTIFVAVFQCPASLDELTTTSSPICKPYLTTRQYLSPYVSPYYKSYLEPYVDAAKPYYDLVDVKVVQPATNFGKQSYATYAAPRMDQARDYGQEQWEKAVKPRLNTAQAQVKKQYDSAVAPHVEKASAAAAPYYTAGRQNVVQAYNERVLPAYSASQPHLQRLYVTAQSTIVEHVYPYANWIWLSSATFMNRSLWPRLRILYGENVEPQLQRISQRLGRYGDGRKLRAIADEDVDEALSAISGGSPPPADAPKSIMSDLTNTPSAKPLSPEEEAQALREQIDNDLTKWKEKFSRAAEKGSEDLKARVQKITERQINSKVLGVGEAHVIRLEETASSEIAKLKKAIHSAAQHVSLSSSNEDIQEAENTVTEAVKTAGAAIKAEAQSLRSWKLRLLNETESSIIDASKSTRNVLDSIGDLGLQEIGMRWANMEGVTYDDWERYHDFRKSLEEWDDKVKATAMEHPGLEAAKTAAGEVDSKGMAVAEDAAKELSRLKQVGLWKVKAIDGSDDFSTRTTPAAVVLAAKKAEEFASVESAKSAASVASEQAAAAASAASSAVIGTEPGVVESASTRVGEAADKAQKVLHEDVVDPISKKVGEASSGASEVVLGSSTPVTEAASSSASSVVSDAGTAVGKASEYAEDAASSASSKVQDVTTKVVEAASKAYKPASKSGESAIGKSTPPSESIASEASEAVESLSSAASSQASAASSKVFAGAMAQEVPQRVIVLDNEDEGAHTEILQKFMDQAANVTKAVKEAMNPTPTQGTVESVTSAAMDQYAKALAAASTALYGPEPSVAEKVSSAASERYAQALTA